MDGNMKNRNQEYLPVRQDIPGAEEESCVDQTSCTPVKMTEKQDINGPLSNTSFVNFDQQVDSTGGEGGGWDKWRYVEVFCAEFFGTGLLMAVGCMGTVAVFSPNGISSLQAGLTFGLIVATLIQIFGHISAAHFNPAVTVCFYMLGEVYSLTQAVVYIVAEIMGATAGLALLKVLTPSDGTCLCCTVPHVSLNEFQSVGVEFVSTCCLILLVCALTDPRNREKQDSAPIKFGLLIVALSFAAGPYTGASMNPARSLAPAIINNVWTGQWVYWLGPLTAGFIVPLFYQTIFCRKYVNR